MVHEALQIGDYCMIVERDVLEDQAKQESSFIVNVQEVFITRKGESGHAKMNSSSLVISAVVNKPTRSNAGRFVNVSFHYHVELSFLKFKNTMVCRFCLPSVVFLVADEL